MTNRHITLSDTGWSPVAVCARGGRLALVQRLVREHGVDPNSHEGLTPLAAAAVSGHPRAGGSQRVPIHHSPFTMRHAPSTIHHTPPTTHYPTFTTHHPLFTLSRGYDVAAGPDARRRRWGACRPPYARARYDLRRRIKRLDTWRCHGALARSGQRERERKRGRGRKRGGGARKRGRQRGRSEVPHPGGGGESRHNRTGGLECALRRVAARACTRCRGAGEAWRRRQPRTRRRGHRALRR